MNLKDLLRTIVASELAEVHSKLARVIRVDQEARTTDLEPLDGSADIIGAQLQPELGEKTGIVQIPRKDSLVIASWISNTHAFVSLVLDPEKILIDSPEIVINQGGNGPLIIQGKLESEINKLNANFDTLINAIKGAPVTPNDGGAAFKTALITALKFQKADLSKVGNDKIKH